MDKESPKEVNNIAPIDAIFESLTDEEKQFLEKINNRIVEQLNKIKETRFDHLDEQPSEAPLDFADRHPEIIHKKHLSVSPHEITIYIKAEVSDIDERGYLNEVKDLFEKYYHIPVAAKEDYKVYVEKFFEKFHSSLEDSCQEIQKEKQQ
jgi:DNA replication initiation complex subunit (GINS family)